MPDVTVLQLDTAFPRVPGDVACLETYLGEVEIIRIPNATVGQIVSARPELIDVAPFADAVKRARGDVVVTSCGFLSYWQDQLAALTDRPFISSALTALPALCADHAAADILTLTFDSESLNTSHLGPYAPDVLGLPPQCHLRQVIGQDHAVLDCKLAQRDLVTLVTGTMKSHHKHLLLECTNLPPYKAALARETQLPVTDILTCIEAKRPGTIQPKFLG